MKNQKLITSFLMLLITAVALTTASYAWFSVTTQVTVEGIDINVTAATGIQVSADAVNWKASIQMADLTTGYTGHKNQIPSILDAVSTIGSQTAGNFEMFNGELIEGGTTTLTTTAAAAEEAGTNGKYIAFDLFFNAPVTMDVYLESPSAVYYVEADEEDTVLLETAIRVAFFNQGTDATATPATARALATGTNLTQKIWEPNALTHTTFALANGATAGVKSSTYGVKAAGSNLPIVDFASQTDYFALVNTITPDTDDPLFEVSEGNIIFTVEPGITKVRIYIWVEGQDIDCENSISLGVPGSKIVVDIKLAKVDR
jgi:hypothetical protein